MDGSGRLWPRADLRVGDEDRQAVVAELQRHFIDGRLNSDELGERVDTALHARIFADLALPLADLPVLPPVVTVEPEVSAEQHDWRYGVLHPPLGAILVLVGVLAMMMLFMLPGRHFGILPFWPILFWGFIFLGRTHTGGRRRY